MPSLNHKIKQHQQFYNTSCIPSAIEIVLKLLGRVPENYHDLQKQWQNKKDGTFLDFDGKTLNGLTFTAHHCPPTRGNNFPLQTLFATIDKELNEGRYVIVSLSVDGGNWHNFVIYDRDNGEYLAVTKGRSPETINDVKDRIQKMKGTDILVYRTT